MDERVSQFTALVNRTGRFRCRVAWNAARERELLKQPAKPLFVLRNVRIVFRVCSFQIGISYQAWSAVTRPRDVDKICIVPVDNPVQMHVNEIEARCCTPVRSEEHTSELQSHVNLVCRLLLEKKNNNIISS